MLKWRSCSGIDTALTDKSYLFFGLQMVAINFLKAALQIFFHLFHLFTA